MTSPLRTDLSTAASVPVADRSAFRLTTKDVMPLSARTNAAAAWRAAGHLGAIAATGAALWYAVGTGWVVPLLLLHGVPVAFLFNVVHETAHQTAFRTRAWNYALGHVAGFVILLPYEYYRAFHWDHHRYTQDPQRDPELAVPLPRTPLAIAWVWSGVPTWVSRIRLLFTHAATGRVTVPWVPAEKRSLIVREARVYLVGYLAVVVASVAAASFAPLWLWVVPLMAGQLFLRPYLLAEHTGCANTSDMLENTRTTYTNPLVRFFAWNMPFHAEHHAYPSVPFHALPRLNTLLAAHIVNTERGYPASAAAVLRHLSSLDHDRSASLASPQSPKGNIHDR